jgi:hypothetical protein
MVVAWSCLSPEFPEIVPVVGTLLAFPLAEETVSCAGIAELEGPVARTTDGPGIGRLIVPLVPVEVMLDEAALLFVIE